jgi:threonine synthase
VAFAAAEKFLASGDMDGHAHTVILATGHPAKEADLVSKCTGQQVDIPGKLAMLRRKVDPIALIDPNIDALQNAIASCF